MCGGTAYGKCGLMTNSGLSPRVRGNHCALPVDRPFARSIPACAGEPLYPALVYGHFEVYPRVCGGTPNMSTPSFSIAGLSPRVRGNP